MSSMLYTMGLAINRAADLGYDVALLVDGHRMEGRIAAHDGVGIVLEQPAAQHSVIRLERVSAVTIMSASPYEELPSVSAVAAEPMSDEDAVA